MKKLLSITLILATLCYTNAIAANNSRQGGSLSGQDCYSCQQFNKNCVPGEDCGTTPLETMQFTASSLESARAAAGSNSRDGVKVVCGKLSDGPCQSSSSSQP